MNSTEVFYLHIQGEQRGPYSLKQIDHLLNSGLISPETLFWREGLEQWLPVTELVVLRAAKERWKLPAFLLVAALASGVMAYFFGPITLAGWREINQHEFTARAAYWRARHAVRNDLLPKATVVNFEPFADAAVDLKAPDRAAVILRGSVLDPQGSWKNSAWEVRLGFEKSRREWATLGAVEQKETPAQP